MQTLSYQDTGDGFPIVLLHGFCESKKLWELYSAILSIKYRVVAIDLPGFGDSAPLQDASPSIDDFAAAVKKTLDQLKIDQFILIGHSLGGYVSLAYAQMYPQHLVGLGLFHSTSFADSEAKKENRNKAIEFVEKYGTQKFVSNLFPDLFSPANKEKLSKQIAYFVRDAAKTAPTSVINTTLAMRDRPDRRDVVSKAPYPIMYIIGKDDVSVPLQQSLQECTLPTESLVFFLSDVGHMGMIEASEQSIAFTEQFIAYCLKKSNK